MTESDFLKHLVENLTLKSNSLVIGCSGRDGEGGNTIHVFYKGEPVGTIKFQYDGTLSD